MKPRSDLFQLIHSLSPTEKRYFKLYASSLSQHKYKKYLLLFDAIAKQKTYDENALIRQFKGQKFTKQFGVAKNYLLHLILRSLREYHSSKDPAFSVQNILQEAHLLYDKGLREASQKMLIKAKNIAEEKELPLYAIDAIDKLEQWFPGIAGNKNQDLMAEKENLLQEIQTIDKCKKGINTINRYLSHPSGNKTPSQNDLAPYLNISFPHVKNPARSPNMYIWRLQLELLQSLANDKKHVIKETASKIAKKFREVYSDSFTHYRQTFDCLYQLGTTLITVQADDQFIQLIEKAGGFENKRQSNTKANLIHNHLRLKHKIVKGNVEQAKQIADQLGKEIQTDHPPCESINLLNQMRYDIAYAYFINGLFNKTLEWLVPFATQESSRNVNDTIVYAHILALIAHFESGHYKVLRYLLYQTVNLTQKSSKLFEYELRYLNFMRTVHNFDSEEQKQKFYQTLLARLQSAEEIKKSARMHEGIACRIDFRDWVKAKIHAKPLASLLPDSQTREFGVFPASPFEY